MLIKMVKTLHWLPRRLLDSSRLGVDPPGFGDPGMRVFEIFGIFLGFLA